MKINDFKGKNKKIAHFIRSKSFLNIVKCRHQGPLSINDVRFVILDFGGHNDTF